MPDGCPIKQISEEEAKRRWAAAHDGWDVLVLCRGTGKDLNLYCIVGHVVHHLEGEGDLSFDGIYIDVEGCMLPTDIYYRNIIDIEIHPPEAEPTGPAINWNLEFDPVLKRWKD